MRKGNMPPPPHIYRGIICFSLKNTEKNKKQKKKITKTTTFTQIHIFPFSRVWSMQKEA